MPKSKQRAALGGGTAQEAEAVFYEALQRGDLELLMSCWADEDEVVCIHPGGPRLLGQTAIRMSFENIFVHGGIAVMPKRVHQLQHLGSAVHSVLERIERPSKEGPKWIWIVVTNVYQNTARGWKLVAHHASEGPSNGGVDELDVHAPIPVLH